MFSWRARMRLRCEVAGRSHEVRTGAHVTLGLNGPGFPRNPGPFMVWPRPSARVKVDDLRTLFMCAFRV